MKKIFFIAAFTFLAWTSPSIAADKCDECTHEVTVTKTAATEEALTAEQQLDKQQAELLIQRVHDIKSMDKSEMTKEQKRALRKEVLTIKEKLHNSEYGYVVLSTGAIIVLFLVLLILL